VQSYTLCIIEDPENENLLFLGTDDGLYISVNAGNKWTKWTEGFPTVPVKDLVIHPREHDLIIGTFGRAAWVLDDIRPLRAMADGTISSKKLALFAPPTAYQAAYQQPTGSRFGADAIYQGENRKKGAIISYYIDKPVQKKKEARDKNQDKKDEDDKNVISSAAEKSKTDENKIKYDSIKLEIFDKNRHIRTLKFKTPKESGIHKTTWSLREKGVARASRKISTSKKEPSGVLVKPGIYRLKMTFGNEVSEQNITVEFDPRLQISEMAINQKYAASKELESYQEKIASIVKQLVESKNTAILIKSNLSKDKKKYTTEIKSSTEIIKKIDSLLAKYLGKIDKRQGITRNPKINVNQRFRLASRYVRSRFGEQTSTESTLMNQFKDEFKKAVLETNSFFNKDWLTYKKATENIKISPFKEPKIYSIK
jgi:hypothetical protein